MEAINFKLEVFEGPLDLLLHLLQKNKVNIYDIPIALITDQYMEYISSMESVDLEVSSEFLVMAARLLYIKSKVILPQHEADEEEEDPREELIQNLIEYKRYKEVAGFFANRKNICDYLYFKTKSDKINYKVNVNPNLDINILTDAFKNVLRKMEQRLPPSKVAFSGIVGREPVPVKIKVDKIKNLVRKNKKVVFESLFEDEESRSGIVAVFLAILEMARNLEITINTSNNKIYICNGDKIE